MKQKKFQKLILKKSVTHVVFDIEHVLISNFAEELNFFEYKNNIAMTNIRQKFLQLYKEAFINDKQIFFVNNTSWQNAEILKHLEKNKIFGRILKFGESIFQQITQKEQKAIKPKEILYIYHNRKNALKNKRIKKVRVKSEFKEFFYYASSHRHFWFQQNIFPTNITRHVDIAFNIMLGTQIQYFMQTVKNPDYRYLLNKNLNFAGAYIYSPLIIKMAQTILREAKQQGLETIYLLARDGYIIEKILNIFAPFYELKDLDIKYIHFNRHHYSTLKNNTANAYIVLEYLKQEIDTRKKVAFYDIGYSGNQMRIIAKALNIKPKFFMIFQTNENYYKVIKNNEDFTTLFTLKNEIVHSQATILETIHSDNYHLSSMKYVKKDHKIIPEIVKNHKIEYDLIQIQEGIVDFAKFYTSKMRAKLQYLEPSLMHIRAIEDHIFPSEEFSLFKNITLDDPLLFNKEKSFLEIQKRIIRLQKQTRQKNLIIAKHFFIYEIYKIIVKNNTQQIIHSMRNLLRKIKGKK